MFALLGAFLLTSTLAVATTLLAPTAVAGAPGDRAGSTVTRAAGVEVVVRPGDTLWGIARTQAPERDPRDVVAAIVEHNALPGPAVNAGDRIVVPAD